MLSRRAALTSRLTIAQSLSRAPKPQTPKCMLKSENAYYFSYLLLLSGFLYHFGPPENGPKSQLKYPKCPFKCPRKNFIFGILFDFGGHISRGSKMVFSDLKCTFGVSRWFRGSAAGRGDCQNRPLTTTSISIKALLQKYALLLAESSIYTQQCAY